MQDRGGFAGLLAPIIHLASQLSIRLEIGRIYLPYGNRVWDISSTRSSHLITTLFVFCLAQTNMSPF